MYARTSFGGAKNVQNWKKGGVFRHIDKFWKGHDGQIKKKACKNAYLGSIFIPENYTCLGCVLESSFTRMTSSLKYKWPPGPFIYYWHLVHFIDTVIQGESGMLMYRSTSVSSEHPKHGFIYNESEVTRTLFWLCFLTGKTKPVSKLVALSSTTGIFLGLKFIDTMI